ncbi:MAG: phosphoglycerate kinase [Candidatus Omnitrophica bacterium 4484_70.2]|nr:MAG: phosphoglycerate kinase [Candidatus Omnitrophica bacterium 4484_70.2]
MAKISVKDLKLENKKVLVRVDFNVPLKEGKITDDTRIRTSLPTINYILKQNPYKLILISHLGRPKGKVVESLRMEPVAKRLEELLGEKVLKLDDCVGEKVKREIDSFGGVVVLLENVRFHPEEEKGDEEFAKKLAELADIFINDAFGTAHRAHASTTGVAKFLPSGIGFLMEKEIEYLSKALNPQKPYVVILGGAKVSDKIGIIGNLLKKADTILIGGAMSYTFLKAEGVEVGNSKVEEEKVDLAKKILEDAHKRKVKIVLPSDHVVVTSPDEPQTKKIVEDFIPQGFMGVDIGPKTVNRFKEELSCAKTVLWNGPLGIFENPHYAEGTKEIALYLAELEAEVIAGGGDTASAAKGFNVKEKLSHVSTGGGASLEFLEGKDLPALSVIPEK